MEVDMRSPSFREMRSGKRCRSPPGSPTTLERPYKRALFALESSTPSPIIQQPELHAYHVNNNPSEDWVKKTDGLHIESASVVSGDSRHVGDDVSMTMDFEEDSSHNRRQIPLPRANQYQGPSFPDVTTTPSNWHDRFPQHPTNDLQCNIFISASHTCDNATLSKNEVHARSIPRINVITATPLDSPQSLQDGNSYPAPTSSRQVDSMSASARKPRFTMGPRSDCEKCRQGVKGHWAHYD
ncbi:hypothetical protein HWV62_30103 [Athelia sp. TMB]|nr:hypothetical protein HWV62_30103 [Athelia sp. TMB]